METKPIPGITTATTTTYYNNDLNQMYRRRLGPDWNYTYEDNGNLTKEDLEGGSQREFTWNADNRLMYVDNIADDNEVEYTYDAMGRRIMKKDVDNNTYTRYYYDGLTVIAEYKKVGAGSWSWDKVMTVAPGVIGNILKIDNSVADDDYYHYDALGNVIMTTLSDTTPEYFIEQEAYGNVKVGSQSGYHLTTKEYDFHPELYYFWQRWYDPMLGRFISTAPYPYYIEHPYIYVDNNPIELIDPEGLFVPKPAGTIILVGGAVVVIGGVSYMCYRGINTPIQRVRCHEDCDNQWGGENNSRVLSGCHNWCDRNYGGPEENPYTRS